MTLPESLTCLRPTRDGPSPAQSAGSALKVAIVNDDACAGQRAMAALERLERGLPAKIWRCPILWRFELLANVAWRCRATDDVAGADVLIVSLSQQDEVPATIARWMEVCLNRVLGRRATVFALFGDGEVWTIARADATDAKTTRPAQSENAPPGARQALLIPFPDFRTA